MGSDPLTSITHKARAFLLGFSAAAVLTKWYGLKVTDIPVTGLNISFDEKLLPLALTVAIFYFFASFLIYAVDDLINITDTPYQIRIRETRQRLSEIAREAATRRMEMTFGFYKQFRDDASRLASLLAKRTIETYRDRDFQNEIQTVLEGIIEERLPIQMDGEKAELHESIITLIGELQDDLWSFEANKHIMFPHRYSLYRRFRVWFFDFGFPIATALLALAVLWWHLLPFAQPPA